MTSRPIILSLFRLAHSSYYWTHTTTTTAAYGKCRAINFFFLKWIWWTAFYVCMYVFMHKFIYLHIVVVPEKISRSPFPLTSLHPSLIVHRILITWTGMLSKIRIIIFFFGGFQFSCEFLVLFCYFWFGLVCLCCLCPFHLLYSFDSKWYLPILLCHRRQFVYFMHESFSFYFFFSIWPYLGARIVV